MVLKQNKRPFHGEDSCQLAHKHFRQLDCGGHLAPFADISSFSNISNDLPTSVGNGPQCQGKSMTEVDSHIICPVASDDKHYQFGCIFTKQLDKNSEMHKVSGKSCINGAYEKAAVSVAADLELKNARTVSFTEKISNSDPTNILASSRHTYSRYDEDKRLESPVRASCFPSFEDGQQIVEYDNLGEIYLPVFGYPHRKPVAIGRNHQAEIPECRPQDFKSSAGESDNCFASSPNCINTSASAAHFPVDDDSSDKWSGTCVLPMPDSGPLDPEVGSGHCRTDCNCVDKSSIRCVRQHAMEARKKLVQLFGEDKFMDLGFGDMGEVVAQKWSEEEEQIFQEVVLSNPASLGKNFWDDLHHVFVSCNSKELVSYYFNVFMLQKRAQQNRSDSLDVDSDNDEWQGSDESEPEDDEDSVVKSPTDGNHVTYSNCPLTDIHEESEYVDRSDDSHLVTDQEYDKGAYDVPEGHIGDNIKFMSDPHLMGRNLNNGLEMQDVQDQLCTFFNGQQNGVDTCSGPADILDTQYSIAEDHRYLHTEYRNNVLDQGYVEGRRDPQTWNMSYFCKMERSVELFPTCNVIEEVFWKGAWQNEAMKNGQCQLGSMASRSSEFFLLSHPSLLCDFVFGLSGIITNHGQKLYRHSTGYLEVVLNEACMYGNGTGKDWAVNSMEIPECALAFLSRSKALLVRLCLCSSF